MSGPKRQGCPTRGLEGSILEERRGLAPRRRVARALLRSSLVRAGLFTVGAVLGTSGCFLPQEDDLLEPIVILNHPPRIVEDSSLLPFAPRSGIPGDGCWVEFKAQVEDPDVDDQVIVRWYIDFDPSSRKIPYDEDRLPNKGTPSRGMATMGFINSPQTLGTAGTHLVTLMVRDGPLLLDEGPGSVPEPDAVPGIDGGITRYAVSHTWVVDTVPTEPCPAGGAQ